MLIDFLHIIFLTLPVLFEHSFYFQFIFHSTFAVFIYVPSALMRLVGSLKQERVCIDSRPLWMSTIDMRYPYFIKTQNSSHIVTIRIGPLIKTSVFNCACMFLFVFIRKRWCYSGVDSEVSFQHFPPASLLICNSIFMLSAIISVRRRLHDRHTF